MPEIREKHLREAKLTANLVRTIELMHNETHLNIVPFLTPILVLPEFSSFQHVAENCDADYTTEAYAIFKRLIDFYHIKVKD